MEVNTSNFDHNRKAPELITSYFKGINYPTTAYITDKKPSKEWTEVPVTRNSKARSLTYKTFIDALIPYIPTHDIWYKTSLDGTPVSIYIKQSCKSTVTEFSGRCGEISISNVESQRKISKLNDQLDNKIKNPSVTRQIIDPIDSIIESIKTSNINNEIEKTQDEIKRLNLKLDILKLCNNNK